MGGHFHLICLFSEEVQSHKGQAQGKDFPFLLSSPLMNLTNGWISAERGWLEWESHWYPRILERQWHLVGSSMHMYLKVENQYKGSLGLGYFIIHWFKFSWKDVAWQTRNHRPHAGCNSRPQAMPLAFFSTLLWLLSMAFLLIITAQHRAVSAHKTQAAMRKRPSNKTEFPL